MGLDPKEYEICLVCGILGQVGESNIAFVLSETFGGLEYCIGESMDSISGILNDEEIEQLKLFYQLEEGDNDLRDQFNVYFDHKMPGPFSGLPFIYHAYPSLISGCPTIEDDNCPPAPYRSGKNQ